MPCDTVRQFLLDTDWDANKRREVAEILQHAEQCEACRAALDDYDAIHRACSPLDDDQVPEPEGGWDAMEGRLASAVKRAPQPGALPVDRSNDQSSDQPIGLSIVRKPEQHRWLRPALGLAAALLIAAAGFELNHVLFPSAHPTADRPPVEKPASLPVPIPQPPAPPAVELTQGRPPAVNPAPVTPPVPVPASPPLLSTPVVSKAVHRFDELSRRLPNPAGWMLVSDEGSPIGLVSDAVPVSRKVLYLRLSLAHGGELVCNSDLMVRVGQDVDLPVSLAAGQSLRYRIGTSLNDPDRVSLSLELNAPQASEPLAVLSTNVNVPPGKKLSVGTFSTLAGEYELGIEFASGELAEAKP